MPASQQWHRAHCAQPGRTPPAGAGMHSVPAQHILPIVRPHPTTKAPLQLLPGPTFTSAYIRHLPPDASASLAATEGPRIVEGQISCATAAGPPRRVSQLLP
jgi:hypothetical protein